MPIKIPKGFQRRKSAGNDLNELPSPPVPSFRVFERPQSTKSFDGGNALKRMSGVRPLSAGQFVDERSNLNKRPDPGLNNRGSGGTNNSASSGGHNDASSSSARFSSTSTLPSSTDIPLDNHPPSDIKGLYDISPPPIPASNAPPSRSAGRSFSFGRKKIGSPPLTSNAGSRTSTEQQQSDDYASFNRPRAMTESSYASGSTATPPKLPDAGLDFGNSDLDSFGTMFESFGKRQSQLVAEPAALAGAKSESPAPMSPANFPAPPRAHIDDRIRNTPPPTQSDGFHDIQASPRSWASGDSQESLMAISTQRAAENLSYHDRFSDHRSQTGLLKSKTMPLLDSATSSERKTQVRQLSGGAGGLQRSSIYASRKITSRSSDLLQDEDARLVMDSLSAGQRLNRQSGALSPYRDNDDETYNPTASLIPRSSYSSSDATDSPLKTPNFGNRQRSPARLFDSSDQDFTAVAWQQSSTETTPRAKKIDLAHQGERSLFDASPPRLNSLTPPQNAKALPGPGKNHKVMTPAQFEKYRKEQETRREQYLNKDDSDGEEGDEYEDDDEIERNNKLARERRKQEAHLAVYRQQMMKVTGEQPSNLPNVPQRPAMERASMSAPPLANGSETPTFSFDRPTEAGKNSDEEDEDVPLGVLAAHGFPSKKRPPTALGSHIQYKSESYPPPPLSMAGSTISVGRGLPPFARHLPPDPYYGAGLVNPSNRESLAFGHNAAPSIPGTPASLHGTPPVSLHPGGLVGVIAGEERARAARRGSPNAQGNYGTPLPPSMPQMSWEMPPGMPPMMSPGEHATVQMSEQMNQMMQMQMQWMQQMQQMMASGMQGMQPGQLPPFMIPPQQQQMLNGGMLAPPGQQQRPISSGAPSAPTATGPQQRAMSMMASTPSPPWQAPGNKRVSVAPSMMSGALGGPGPGYAPSNAPSERSNVGMPSRYRPVSIAPSDEHASRVASRTSTLTSGMLLSGDRQSKLSVKPVSLTPPKKSIGSDDDDEEGWEEMRKKREKKKSTWRLRKKKDETSDLETYDYPEA